MLFRYLKIDMKRFLSLKMFFMIVMAAVAYTCVDDEIKDVAGWLIDISFGAMFMLVASCLSINVYATSLCDDFEYGYIRSIVTRGDIGSYTMARVLSVFLSSFITTAIGFLGAVFIMIKKYGIPKVDINNNDRVAVTLYKNIYGVNPGDNHWFKLALCIAVHLASLSGVMALIGMLASIYINNRMLVCTIPAAVIMVLDMLLQRAFGIDDVKQLVVGARLSLYASGLIGISCPLEGMTIESYYLMIGVYVIILSFLIFEALHGRIKNGA